MVSCLFESDVLVLDYVTHYDEQNLLVHMDANLIHNCPNLSPSKNQKILSMVEQGHVSGALLLY